MRVGIIGTGLIGASIARAAVDIRASVCLHDVDRERAINVAAAVESNVAASVEDLAGCSIVFVCTPPQAIAGYVLALAATDAVVVDVGSAKRTVIDEVARGGGNRSFVPGHPLSGGIASGPAGAGAAIITRRLFVLTPYAGIDEEALETARAFLARLGARVVTMAPETHDRLMALLSHVPHLLSFALLDTLAGLTEEEREMAAALLPHSFETMTQFADADPALWAEIFAQNRAEIGRAAERLSASMARVAGASPATLTALRDQRRGLKR